MRLNQYIALHTGISRRRADQLIKSTKVTVNGSLAYLGRSVDENDKVVVNGLTIQPADTKLTTIMLNKPAGYVCSRAGQGSKTIYDLLPAHLRNLKPVGRLDKDSSGLLLLTNDGNLANQLTHPSHQKEKVYEVELDRALGKEDHDRITKASVQLEDGPSKLRLNGGGKSWKVTMREGRNRQIRRTFKALGYEVKSLHRIHFGSYSLTNLETSHFRVL